LIRDRVFAHYFGNSDAADVFKAAFRIPNFLQNLFGEGVLSASFIPVYANLLARDDKEEARKTAGAVAALLSLSTAILVMFGVLAAPWLIEAIAPGFHGEKPYFWYVFCFPAQAFWWRRRGASVFLTATGNSFSRTPRRCCGTSR